MMTVTPDMQALLSNSDGLTPVIDLSVPLTQGVYGEFTSYQQMQGANEPATQIQVAPAQSIYINPFYSYTLPARYIYISTDVNLDANRISGQLTLAAGSTHPIAPVSTPASSLVAAIKAAADLAAVLKTAVYEVTSKGNYKVNGRSVWGVTYGLTGTTRTVTKKTLGVKFAFVAQTTLVLDSLRLNASLVGTTTSKATVYIEDATQNIISQRVTVTLTTTLASITITGLNAVILAGMAHNIVIIAEAIPNASTPGSAKDAAATIYTQTLTCAPDKLAAAPWIITTSVGYGFYIGGTSGYQASGNGYRSLDVGGIPSLAGFISITAKESTLYPLVIDLYSTNDPALFAVGGVTSWTLQASDIKSGSIVQPAQYFRFHITMTANAAQDIAPILESIAIYFDGMPALFTTRTQLVTYANGSIAVKGEPVLHNISSLSSQLTTKPASVFSGKLQAIFANEPRSLALLNDAPSPIGRPVSIALGFDSLIDRVNLFEGIVEDVRYTPEKITLMVTDSIKLADVTIPKKDTYKSYDNAADYAVNALVTHKFFTYKALLANGVTSAKVIEPSTDATVWLAITSPKVYSPITNGGQDWHLVDIILDMLRNEINVPDNRIDMISFSRIKALRGGYVGKRTLIKPEKASAMLGELAWLLEAQWVQLSGGISLIPEPLVGAPTPNVIPHINDNDIRTGSFTYRRGWKELVNECVIMTQWDGKNYNSVTAYADAASVASLRVVQQEVGHDKWNMPPLILDAIAKSVVTRKNKARRVLSFVTSGKNLRLECGDKVTFESTLLPASDPALLHCMVVKKDLTDWAKQTINLTLMEVL